MDDGRKGKKHVVQGDNLFIQKLQCYRSEKSVTYSALLNWFSLYFLAVRIHETISIAGIYVGV